jgi:DNA-directed RNA polymerase specialized sigma24 family protein
MSVTETTDPDEHGLDVLRRVKRGDPDAVKMVRDWIYRRCRAHGVGAQDADDLTQDVWIKLQRTFDTANEPRQTLWGWLGRTTSWELADFYKRQSRARTDPTEDVDLLDRPDSGRAESDRDEEILDPAIRAQVLADATARSLEPKHRLIGDALLNGFRQEGRWLTTDELLAATGLTDRNDVYGRKHQAISFLRKSLAAEHMLTMLHMDELRCAGLRDALAAGGWDGKGPVTVLWRGRLARHARSCPNQCRAVWDGAWRHYGLPVPLLLLWMWATTWLRSRLDQAAANRQGAGGIGSGVPEERLRPRPPRRGQGSTGQSRKMPSPTGPAEGATSVVTRRLPTGRLWSVKGAAVAASAAVATATIVLLPSPADGPASAAPGRPGTPVASRAPGSSPASPSQSGTPTTQVGTTGSAAAPAASTTAPRNGTSRSPAPTTPAATTTPTSTTAPPGPGTTIAPIETAKPTLTGFSAPFNQFAGAWNIEQRFAVFKGQQIGPGGTAPRPPETYAMTFTPAPALSGYFPGARCYAATWRAANGQLWTGTTAAVFVTPRGLTFSASNTGTGADGLPYRQDFVGYSPNDRSRLRFTGTWRDVDGNTGTFTLAPPGTSAGSAAGVSVPGAEAPPAPAAANQYQALDLSGRWRATAHTTTAGTGPRPDAASHTLTFRAASCTGYAPTDKGHCYTAIWTDNATGAREITASVFVSPRGLLLTAAHRGGADGSGYLQTLTAHAVNDTSTRLRFTGTWSDNSGNAGYLTLTR